MIGLLKFFEEDEELFKKFVNLEKLFLHGCEYDKIDLVKQLIQHYPEEFNYRSAFLKAYRNSSYEVMKFLYSKRYFVTLRCAILSSFYDERALETDLVKFLHMLDPNMLNLLSKTDYRDILINIARNNILDLAKWLYEMKPSHFTEPSFIYNVCRYGDVKMLKWLLEVCPDIDNDYKTFRDAKYESKEWLYIISDEKEKLLSMCHYTTKERLLKLHDAARVIENAWLDCYYSPYTKIGIKRLNKEYDELVEDGIIIES